ncbi:MAG: diacylglycerol/polyprenol kinase family protein [Candidatus Asgardarchaeia archaeon]
MNNPLPFLPVFVWNLIAGSIFPLIYIFFVIGLMGKLVEKGFPQDLSRKVVHIAAGSWIWVWPLLDPSDGWSYIFNITVAALWTLLFIKTGLKGSPEDTAVKTMTRTGNPRELLLGPLFFTLSMEYIGIFHFMTFLGVVVMGFLGWGDGLAPYIGSRYGKHKYKLFGREKSIEGSVIVFLAGLFGSILLYVLVFYSLPTMSMLLWMIVFGIVATIIEAISPSDVDNLLIPAALVILAFIIDVILPGAGLFVMVFPHF